MNKTILIKNNGHTFPFVCQTAYWVLGALFFLCSSAYSQDQELADSLEKIYLQGNYRVEDQLDILSVIAYNHPDPEKSLIYSEELLGMAQAMDSLEFVIGALMQKGNALRLKGDLTKALDSYFLGAKLAIEDQDKRQLGLFYVSIAGVYSIMGNQENTIDYYENAISILREVNDSLNYAKALENLGDEYNLYLNKPDSALLLFEESGAIFNALNYEIGIAYNTGNIGLAYAKKGKNQEAEEYITKATEILSRLGDYYPICVYLTYMADIYLEKGYEEAARNYAHRSLDLALQFGLKEQIKQANLKLSDLYERAGNTDKALEYLKNHILYKDSVNNIASVQQMAKIQTDFAVSQKQLEVDLLNQQKKNQRIIFIATVIALFLIALLALVLYRRFKYIEKTSKIIETEKKRSERLLLNILPQETAEELKEFGRVQAKRFESITVLFTDFEGFTNYSENLHPEQLVESVDFYFSKFDEIIEKHGLEKIKTIGDAYMGAGGLHSNQGDHAIKMVLAAFEIIEFVREAKKDNAQNKLRFDIRIGINTGPVVAGVVGTKKFSYDIWGDTVNVASRMEAMSGPGKINLSEHTYALLQDTFDCEYRGERVVRNRGKMKMYFANSIK